MQLIKHNHSNYVTKNGGGLSVNPRRKDFSMQSLQKRCMHSITTLVFRMMPEHKTIINSITYIV